MVDKNFFEELSQQIAKLMPAANALSNDVRKSIAAAMQSSFQKMDLVTREEFDAQVAALARANEKITAMEELIRQLETRMSEAATNGAKHEEKPGIIITDERGHPENR
jgi:ubiquinone biosynthesis accessory factor UbiK